MSVRPNELHLKLAQRILSHARMFRLQPGHHLKEQSLQELLGLSRGPIRAALSYLAEKGVVRKAANRGFFLVAIPSDIDVPLDMAGADEERTYLAIAADRLRSTIGEVVTETQLMRRYGLTRNRLLRILRRIASEGWIERRSGHGWSFLPMIDSVQAYQESYYLRSVVEPAGILASGFALDQPALTNVKSQQMFVYSEGFRTLSRVELFEMNNRFHETIASMSGNRFIFTTVFRQNQLRRLVEYRQYLDRDRARRQCAEHLEIITCLAKSDYQAAASMMMKHLTNAVKEKAREVVFTDELEKQT